MKPQQTTVESSSNPTHPNAEVLHEYSQWLRDYRGLPDDSINKNHIHYVNIFLTSQDPCGSSLSALSPDSVEHFFLGYCLDHGQASRKKMQSALRIFLSFCWAEGHVKRNLSVTVPTWRTYGLATLPRYIEDESLQRILARVDRTTRTGRRDYAILQLLYTYGMRSKQIRYLRLSDINWRRSEIFLRGLKNGKDVLLPLIPSVGDSLLDYLRHARPSASCPEIFLTAVPPYRPLGCASSVYNITKQHARAAGIVSPLVGPHLFRHALATRMLAGKHSLKEIADVLGHRRLQTTFIYTKVDFQNLSQVPLEWPED